MGKQDWFRRRSWTEDESLAFFERLKRCRGADSKAQYLRIQAQTLLETGDEKLVEVALGLLERSFLDFPDAFDCAPAYECAGECLLALGRDSEAVSMFRRALRRQRERRGIITNTCFAFGRAAVERGWSDCYEEVLGALDEFGVSHFPWHAYMANGIRAVIAASKGESQKAAQLARTALAAARATHSGLRYHPDVGLVRDTSTKLHEMLETLGGAQRPCTE